MSLRKESNCQIQIFEFAEEVANWYRLGYELSVVPCCCLNCSNWLVADDIQHCCTQHAEYNRQGDSPESLIITAPNLLAALVAIVAPCYVRVDGAW